MNIRWSSEDGAPWKLVTAHAAFPRRVAHMAAVLDGTIWVQVGDGAPSDSGSLWVVGREGVWRMSRRR